MIFIYPANGGPQGEFCNGKIRVESWLLLEKIESAVSIILERGHVWKRRGY